MASPAAQAGDDSRWPALLMALVVVATVLAGWAMRTRVPLLHNLEGQVIDFQHRARGTISPGANPGIAVLLIDDATIKALGRLPIHRGQIARAVDRLHADGAALVVFDLIFADAARYDSGEDAELAAAIGRAGNVVLPYSLMVAGGEAAAPGEVLEHAYARYRNEDRRELIPFKPAGIVAPIPAFARQALALGNVSVLPGHDGALRFDLPALWFDEEFFPTLALRVAALAAGIDWTEVEAHIGEEIVLGARTLPLDVVSRQWVNYYGPGGTFPTYSFVDYLSGRLDPALFRGRIVLVGGSALGTSDRYPSPFDPALPGVERIATVIDNLLSQRWLARPGWAAPVELAAIVLLPLLATRLIRRRRPVSALAILTLVGLTTMALAQLVFVLRHEFISVAFPMAALLLASGFGIALRARSDERSRRQAEARLKASELRYALAARGANDGLWDWDLLSGEVFYSPRWHDLMGTELLDAPALTRLSDWTESLDQLERERFQRELDAHLAGQTQQFSHVFRLVRGGEERWLLARAVAVREHQQPIRVAGSITDITEQKRLEQRIAFDALHDRLTGLANRDLFVERLDQLLRAQIGGIQQAGVIMIDLDGFLAIDDKYGQFGCNALLLEFSRRLSGLAGNRLPTAHLGGDQFALGYSGPADRELARAVRELLATPIDLEGHSENISATIATAHSAQGLESASELLSAASLALAAGKRDGRGRIHDFDPATQEVENSRRWLRDNIEHALAAGNQFELFYQPFVRLADRELLGFEALIRWRHPERGLVMPNDFIPFAERSGQINAIGRWTLLAAARQLVAWDALGFTGEIAVNLSSRQFTESDLEGDAREILRIIGGIAPSRMKLEVTESMSMANPQVTTEILHKLTAMGFKISVDDFGTGYSSLAYLHRFPFHTLKIDRSFVIRLGSGREAQEIVRTIASLARTLGKQVLAEGVEDETQAKTLHSLGTEVGQGWLFARPLPAERAEAWFCDREAVRPAA